MEILCPWYHCGNQGRENKLSKATFTIVPQGIPHTTHQANCNRKSNYAGLQSYPEPNKFCFTVSFSKPEYLTAFHLQNLVFNSVRNFLSAVTAQEPACVLHRTAISCDLGHKVIPSYPVLGCGTDANRLKDFSGIRKPHQGRARLFWYTWLFFPSALNYPNNSK